MNAKTFTKNLVLSLALFLVSFSQLSTDQDSLISDFLALPGIIISIYALLNSVSRGYISAIFIKLLQQPRTRGIPISTA